VVDGTSTDKNQRIKTTLLATKKRRKDMYCKTYELKINKRHLSFYQRKHLEQLFLEAKWFTNDILSSNEIFSYDSKTESVSVICPDTVEERALTHLSSHMKQSLVKQIQTDIISLSKKKKKGCKVGKLNFKKCMETIPLKQHNNTYTLLRPNKLHIQGLKGFFKLRGLAQVPPDAEFAEAKLRFVNTEFYLLVTCYLPKTEVRKQKREQVPKLIVGIDAGIKNQLTLSNGIQIHYNIVAPKNFSQSCKNLSRKKYGSKNYIKSKTKLQKKYKTWNNRKKDTINQLVNKITSSYYYIIFQNDPIANWQRLFGKRLLNTALGQLFTTLEKRAVSSCVIDQWQPTTKRCSNTSCGYNLPKSLPLGQRMFICPKCGFKCERDLNAARVDEQLGTGELKPIPHRNKNKKVKTDDYIIFPSGRRKIMPLETNTAIQDLKQSLDRLPYVSVQVLSVKKEAPSL